MVFFVEGCDPQADFKFNYLETGDTFKIKFTADTLLPEKGDRFYWDFGNGQKDTGISAEGYFTGPSDKYPAQLKVCNDCGCDSIVIKVPIMRVGIQVAEKQTLSIYPNPSNNSIRIKHYENWAEKEKYLIIINAMGQKVMEKTLENNSLDSEISIEHLATSHYTLMLKVADTWLHAPLVVLR